MSAVASSSSAGKTNRLFIGNLAPNVDEYTLVQVFSKYGKITKLDIMYHKTGPLKGKPRGYAFVEYSSTDVGALFCLLQIEARRCMVEIEIVLTDK
jgi:RNA recognition motif-containing protein